jgi:hypothetical protein
MQTHPSRHVRGVPFQATSAKTKDEIITVPRDPKNEKKRRVPSGEMQKDEKKVSRLETQEKKNERSKKANW